MATTFLKISTLNSDLTTVNRNLDKKLPYGTIFSSCDPTNDKGSSCWTAPFWIKTTDTSGTKRPAIGFELSGRRAGILYLANEGLYFMDNGGTDHVIVRF